MCVSLLMLLWTWNQWHRLRIAHGQKQFHPRWNLTAAKYSQRKGIKTRPDTSCLRSWGHRWTVVEAVFQDYLKISTTFGGSGLFFRWKENYLSCHLKSWFGPRSHFTTFAHHVITLKDKRIEQLNITIHHKQEGAVWCHTTNGCTAEIPATC